MSVFRTCRRSSLNTLASDRQKIFPATPGELRNTPALVVVPCEWSRFEGRSPVVNLRLAAATMITSSTRNVPIYIVHFRMAPDRKFRVGM
jgi:hypothetical protein